MNGRISFFTDVVLELHMTRSRGSILNELQPAPDLSLTRWTLFELFVIVTFAGTAAFCASAGATSLGVCLFVTAISVRIATVDFSLAGKVASGFVLLFGIPTICFALLWAMNC